MVEAKDTHGDEKLLGYWRVPREWIGETAFLLGGGPSLKGFNSEILRGHGRVVAINSSYIICPWAHVLYYCDRTWWRNHREDVLANYSGQYRVSLTCAEDGTKLLRNAGLNGLSIDPSALVHGTNSGYQAIGLAFHFGVKRIVLLGFDMRVTQNGSHHHPPHIEGLNDEQFHRMLTETMLPRFPSLVEPLRKAGIEVIQATPKSALTCWAYRPLEEVLKEEK